MNFPELHSFELWVIFPEYPVRFEECIIVAYIIMDDK